MAIDYAGLAQTASLLLGENGKASAYLRTTPVTANDPVAGTVTEGVATDTACNAVLTQHDERYTPGATVQEGDMFLVLDARANMGDELVVDGTAYRIVNVWPIKPGDTFIACRVQVRA